MEFYHTAGRTFTDLLRTGAASFKRWLGCAPQVIAPVLPFEELKEHSPSLAYHRDCDAEWTDARNSPTPPLPAHNGTFIG